MTTARMLPGLFALAAIGGAAAGCAQSDSHPPTLPPGGTQTGQPLGCGDLLAPEAGLAVSQEGDILANGDPAPCGPDGVYCPLPDLGTLPAQCVAAPGEVILVNATCVASLWHRRCTPVEAGAGDAGDEPDSDAGADAADAAGD